MFTRIKAKMRELQLQQCQLARRLHCDRGLIGLWANGWQRPPEKWRHKLAETLDADMGELFDSEGWPIALDEKEDGMTGEA